MSLPNLFNTNHLRKLTIGINSSQFLEHLLLCIPFIENLSVGVHDQEMYKNNKFHMITLPSAVDACLLRYLTRLHINCVGNRSFHRTINLLSSVFGQLNHLSLKLSTSTSLSDRLIISGDTIQKLCIDRLKPLSMYTLNLLFYVEGDLTEKVLFTSFVESSFTGRKRPKVIIREFHRNSDIFYNGHRFVVYTLPYYGTVLETSFIPEGLETSSERSMNRRDLFPHINELFLNSDESKNCLSDLADCTSSMSTFVPWSLLTKITINNANINAVQLESILRLADHVHTLELIDDNGILTRDILNNKDNLSTILNRKIQSLNIDDCTLILVDTQNFLTLLVHQLPNLKKLSFIIYEPSDGSNWNPFYIVDGEKIYTKYILDLIYFLIDHLQQLVSLHIYFVELGSPHTPCFPHLIRKQFHQWRNNQPYRLQCSVDAIEIWI